MNISKLEYNQSTHFYDEIMNSFQMDFSLYEDLIEILKPKSVLELGCGMGRLFPIFMREAKEVTGVDLSSEMISEGNKYYASCNTGKTSVKLINGNMCSFKSNKKYDLVVLALSVLKHLSTDEERLAALKIAKEHLNEDGFIVIDHKPFLYSSKNTSWIDAQHSLVKDWVSDPSVLEGYQWKKHIDGDIDILQWRYKDSEKVKFDTKFTTYLYEINKLIEHFQQLNLRHEQILTEWGCNGLSNEGTRFIGLVSYPNKDQNLKLKQKLMEKISKRNERLWSDHDLYEEHKTK